MTLGPHAENASAASPEVTRPHLSLCCAQGIRRLLTQALEIVTAILVSVEIVILFAGVVARYGLHSPLIWSDELASLLFLWLAVLGAALAFYRGEHMRMTAFVGTLKPHNRSTFEVAAITAAMCFLLMGLYPASDYVHDAGEVVMDSLQISNSWRACALPVGFSLMVALGGLKLIELAQSGKATRRDLVWGISVPIAAVVVFALLEPVLRSLGDYNLLIFFFGAVSVGVITGVPIAFSFALATFGYLALTTRVPLVVVLGRMDEGMSHIILLAVPMFVFLGHLMTMTGMARAMVNFLASLFGHVRGGLSYVLIGAMYLVSGISGAKAADMAAVAPVLFPEMQKRGEEPGDLIALLAATGAQTETIPPSIVLITIGSVTGVSIASLFTGGLLPGLVLAIMLCFVVWTRCRKKVIADMRRASWGEIGRFFGIAFPALLLPIVIRYCVVEGVATATEVSTVGVFYCVLAGLLFYREFDWRQIKPMLVDTAVLSGTILLIIGSATSMAWALTQSGFSQLLASWMESLPGGSATFMAVSVLTFMVLGSILEGIPVIVLFGPLLFPIARAMGIHEVQYAIVAILAMGLGLFAPPIGLGYYMTCAIGRVSPDEGMRHIWRYLFALFIGVVAIAAIPWLSIGFL